MGEVELMHPVSRKSALRTALLLGASTLAIGAVADMATPRTAEAQIITTEWSTTEGGVPSAHGDGTLNADLSTISTSLADAAGGARDAVLHWATVEDFPSAGSPVSVVSSSLSSSLSGVSTSTSHQSASLSQVSSSLSAVWTSIKD